MHIKITDFGTAKIFSGPEVNEKGKYTVCNSPCCWNLQLVLTKCPEIFEEAPA